MAEYSERPKSRIDRTLPFEKPLVELEERAMKAESEEEKASLLAELDQRRQDVFSRLSAWERIQLARHQLRPKMLDYTTRILDDLIELHGDRISGDDPAVVGGIGRFQGRTLVVLGQQKGATYEENIRWNWGMAHPEGYRKALRLFQLAERLKLPILTLVDTPGADPGVDAEMRGQGPSIAANLVAMLQLKTPLFSVVIGEGGSGGALGIALGDWVAMFENAAYMVCAPERCAEILWRDKDQREIAATALRITARDLKDLGVIDVVLPEPGGGAHRNPDAAAHALAEELDRFLVECDKGTWTLARRQQKFQQMGVWLEVV